MIDKLGGFRLKEIDTDRYRLPAKFDYSQYQESLEIERKRERFEEEIRRDSEYFREKERLREEEMRKDSEYFREKERLRAEEMRRNSERLEERYIKFNPVSEVEKPRYFSESYYALGHKVFDAAKESAVRELKDAQAAVNEARAELDRAEARLRQAQQSHDCLQIPVIKNW